MASTMKQADAKIGVPAATQERARTRRTYALQFKRDVVAQCLEPGASVSAIALSHRINANVIRKWLPRHGGVTSTVMAMMLPVKVEPAAVVVNPKRRMTMPLADPRPPTELILNGATVRLPAGFDPAELRSIVQILAARR
jgi:transposase-like protein